MVVVHPDSEPAAEEALSERLEVRLSPSLLAEVRAAAAREGRPIASTVRAALAAAVTKTPA